MKHTALGKGTSKSKGSSIKRENLGNLRVTSPQVKFVVCIKSGGYVDLEPLKIFKVRRDTSANAAGLLRVIDSSGEDYLYPVDYFLAIRAPQRLFQLIED